MPSLGFGSRKRAYVVNGTAGPGNNAKSCWNDMLESEAVGRLPSSRSSKASASPRPGEEVPQPPSVPPPVHPSKVPRAPKAAPPPLPRPSDDSPASGIPADESHEVAGGTGAPYVPKLDLRPESASRRGRRSSSASRATGALSRAASAARATLSSMVSSPRVSLHEEHGHERASGSTAHSEEAAAETKSQQKPKSLRQRASSVGSPFQRRSSEPSPSEADRAASSDRPISPADSRKIIQQYINHSDGAKTAPAVAPAVPSGTVVLEAIHAQTGDIGVIPPESRILPVAITIDGGGRRSIQIGRQYQPEYFERFVDCHHISCISRRACCISWGAEGSPVEPLLNVTGSGQVWIDDVLCQKGFQVPLKPGSRVLLATTSSQTNERLSLVELSVHFDPLTRPAPKVSTDEQTEEELELVAMTDQLLAKVYQRQLDSSAAEAVLDSCPEVAWLAQCALNAPLPPYWKRCGLVPSSDPNSKGGTPCYANTENGAVTERSPQTEGFAKLARWAIHARKAPSEAATAALWVMATRDEALNAALEAQEGWTGPHSDEASGSEFYHCEATGSSCWTNPAAAPAYMAHVADQLLRSQAFPVDASAASVEAKAKVRQDSARRQDRHERERRDNAEVERRGNRERERRQHGEVPKGPKGHGYGNSAGSSSSCEKVPPRHAHSRPEDSDASSIPSSAAAVQKRAHHGRGKKSKAAAPPVIFDIYADEESEDLELSPSGLVRGRPKPRHHRSRHEASVPASSVSCASSNNNAAAALAGAAAAIANAAVALAGMSSENRPAGADSLMAAASALQAVGSPAIAASPPLAGSPQPVASSPQPAEASQPKRKVPRAPKAPVAESRIADSPHASAAEPRPLGRSPSNWTPSPQAAGVAPMPMGRSPSICTPSPEAAGVEPRSAEDGQVAVAQGNPAQRPLVPRLALQGIMDDDDGEQEPCDYADDAATGRYTMGTGASTPEAEHAGNTTPTIPPLALQAVTSEAAATSCQTAVEPACQAASMPPGAAESQTKPPRRLASLPSQPLPPPLAGSCQQGMPSLPALRPLELAPLHEVAASLSAGPADSQCQNADAAALAGPGTGRLAAALLADALAVDADGTPRPLPPPPPPPPPAASPLPSNGQEGTPQRGSAEAAFPGEAVAEAAIAAAVSHAAGTACGPGDYNATVADAVAAGTAAGRAAAAAISEALYGGSSPAPHTLNPAQAFTPPRLSGLSPARLALNPAQAFTPPPAISAAAQATASALPRPTAPYPWPAPERPEVALASGEQQSWAGKQEARSSPPSRGGA